jgi:hypothetical protein
MYCNHVGSLDIDKIISETFYVKSSQSQEMLNITSR